MLSVNEIAALTTTLNKMQQRATHGLNSINVLTFSITPNSIFLNINATNNQTNAQLAGSIKGCLNRRLNTQGLFM